MTFTVKSKINGTVITTEEHAASKSEAKSKVKHRYGKQHTVENITVVTK